MSFRRTNDIKALSEQLGSIQIIEETLEDYEWSDTEMSVASAAAAINEKTGREEYNCSSRAIGL